MISDLVLVVMLVIEYAKMLSTRRPTSGSQLNLNPKGEN